MSLSLCVFRQIRTNRIAAFRCRCDNRPVVQFTLHRRFMSSPVPALPPSGDEKSVQRFAVYGTLRDDDDSGATWTAPFLKGLTSAVTGTVSGFQLFGSTKLGYPFAVRTQKLAANGTAPASPAAAAPLTVRVLHWSDVKVWDAKLKEADMYAVLQQRSIATAQLRNSAESNRSRHRHLLTGRIEVYDPLKPDAGEYVRQLVDVQLAVTPGTNSAAAVSTVSAWMYIPRVSVPHSDWVVIPSGDWLKRDRTLFPPPK